MPDTLDRRRTDAALPPIFSVRTTGPLAVAAAAGAVLLAVPPARPAGVALLAWASVLLPQQVGPLLREASKRTHGRSSAMLFNLPFALFFLPALVWTVAVRPDPGAASALVVLGVVFGLAMQALDWKQWRLGFDRDLLELLPPVPTSLLVTQTWMLAGSAVFQELFYRGVLPAVLGGANLALVVAASTLAFVLEHTSNRWGKRAHGRVYYVRLTVLSVGLGLLAAEVSLVAALAAHLAFNAVPWAQLLLRRRVHRPRSTPQSSLAVPG